MPDTKLFVLFECNQCNNISKTLYFAPIWEVNNTQESFKLLSKELMDSQGVRKWYSWLLGWIICPISKQWALLLEGDNKT